jgi:hypothetical protein
VVKLATTTVVLSPKPTLPSPTTSLVPLTTTTIKKP